MHTATLPILGRTAHVSIPALGLHDSIARVDTGAFGGALHAKVHGVIEEKGKRYLRFSVFDGVHPGTTERIFQIETFTQKRVRSAHGQVEMRYKIPLTLVLNGQSVTTEVGITDRSTMKHSFLLGRAAIAGNFLIDVSKEI